MTHGVNPDTAILDAWHFEKNALFDLEMPREGVDSIPYSEYLEELYDHHFSGSPKQFFSKPHLEHLRQQEKERDDQGQSLMPPSARLLYLSVSAKSMEIGPQEIDAYFSYFPEDEKRVMAILCNTDFKNIAVPRDGESRAVTLLRTAVKHGPLYKIPEVNLLALTLGRIYEKHGASILEDLSEPLLAYIFWRNQAPAIAFETTAMQLPEHFAGPLSKFDEEVARASSVSVLGLDKPVATHELFTSQEWKHLRPKERSKALRACLMRLHDQMLVHEVRIDAPYVGQRQLSLFRKEQFSFGYGLSEDMLVSLMGRGMRREYPLFAITLAVLEEFENTGHSSAENTETLVEFWLKNRLPIFTDAVTKAIIAQGAFARSAVGELLQAMQKDHSPHSIAAILFRIDAFHDPARAREVIEDYEQVFRLKGTLREIYQHMFNVSPTDLEMDAQIEKEMTRARVDLAHLAAHGSTAFMQYVEQLEKIISRTRLFIGACRALKQQKKMGKEVLKSLVVEEVRGGEISDELIRHMVAIQERRYAGKYSFSMRKELIEKMILRLRSPQTRVFLLRAQLPGQRAPVTSYCIFTPDPERPSNMFMSSVMLDEEFEGTGLGSVALSEAVRIVGEKYDISAVCDDIPGLIKIYAGLGFAVSQHYVEDEPDDRGNEIRSAAINRPASPTSPTL